MTVALTLAPYRSLVLERVVGCDEDEEDDDEADATEAVTKLRPRRLLDDDDDEAIPAAVGSAEAIIITLIMRVCK